MARETFIPEAAKDYAYPPAPARPVLQREGWDAVMASISRRLRAIEVKGDTLDSLVADLSFNGQARIDAAITPLIEQVRRDVVALEAAVDAAVSDAAGAATAVAEEADRRVALVEQHLATVEAGLARIEQFDPAEYIPATDKQVNRLDATAGRLLVAGAFGLGSVTPPGTADADAITVTGSYSVGHTWTGSPFPSGDARNYGVVRHEAWLANYATQLFFPANIGPVMSRQRVNAPWRAWEAIATAYDLASKLNLSGDTLTGALSFTPGTFEVLTGGTKAVAYSASNRRHFELRSGANTFDVTGIPESGGDLELDFLYTAGTLAFAQPIRWKFNGTESTNLADTPVILTAGVRYAVVLWNMGGTLYGVIG